MFDVGIGGEDVEERISMMFFFILCQISVLLGRAKPFHGSD